MELNETGLNKANLAILLESCLKLIKEKYLVRMESPTGYFFDKHENGWIDFIVGKQQIRLEIRVRQDF